MITPTTTLRIPTPLRAELDAVRAELQLNQSQAIFAAIELWIQTYKEQEKG